MLTRAKLLEFLRSERYAVQASVTGVGAPQAAVVGVAVTDELEVVFDTLESTRKAVNLRRNPRVALIFGLSAAEAGRTVQMEGIADEPQGEERARLVNEYLKRFPDGVKRQSWPGLIYVRVRPTWLRYSDYSETPPLIEELTLTE